MSDDSEVGIRIDRETMDNNITVNADIGREILVLDKNKVKICLMENQKKLEAQQEWRGALGILITLIIALSTTTGFKPFPWSSAVWYALFLFTAIAVGVWLIYLVYQNKQAEGAKSIDELIEELQKDAQQASLTQSSSGSGLEPKLKNYREENVMLKNQVEELHRKNADLQSELEGLKED